MPTEMIQSEPGKRVGAKAIAAFFNKPPRWLYRKLQYAKRCPPVYQPAGPGTEYIAFDDELDQWARRRKPQPA